MSDFCQCCSFFKTNFLSSLLPRRRLPTDSYTLSIDLSKCNLFRTIQVSLEMTWALIIVQLCNDLLFWQQSSVAVTLESICLHYLSFISFVRIETETTCLKNSLYLKVVIQIWLLDRYLLTSCYVGLSWSALINSLPHIFMQIFTK